MKTFTLSPEEVKAIEAKLNAVGGRPIVETIPISAITRDESIRVREAINEQHARELAASLEAGDELPAIDLFFDGSILLLAGGDHRILAHKITERGEIKANIFRGGRPDAVLHALGSNYDHGLRRSRADKRAAIETALLELSQRSDRQIAKLCHVNHKTVADVRAELERTGEIPSYTEREDKHGCLRKAVASKSLSQTEQQKLADYEARIEHNIDDAREFWDAIATKALLTGKDHRTVFREVRPEDHTVEEWEATWAVFAPIFVDDDDDKSLLPAGADLVRFAYQLSGEWGCIELLPSREHFGYAHISVVDMLTDGPDGSVYTKRPIAIGSLGRAVQVTVPEHLHGHLRGGQWRVAPVESVTKPLREMLEWPEDKFAEEIAAAGIADDSDELY